MITEDSLEFLDDLKNVAHNEDQMTELRSVTTELAPAPLGHYRQAIKAGGFIHVSGQLPIMPGTPPDNQSASFEAQARLVIQNFLAIVSAGGGKTQDVVKVTAYIVGSVNWPAFNKAFADAFGDHRPARSVVPVPELHHGYLIEVDGIALDAGTAWRRTPEDG